MTCFYDDAKVIKALFGDVNGAVPPSEDILVLYLLMS